ncbi:transcriptional regulator [Scardovia inopinata]|uniref:HTH cro/C1-type domain-containing protein n=1 Tax=Scardovia inopinata F0304 TaxID=641146 RepID=W5IJP4_SCAIO|nr:helix-turn-helix transcriptional regulator [Scardovia inopinata]EFG27231.2 hypothetical protein HMPREF9020_00870 [Scardovia inopinata F0304]BAR06842.1 transcriptional regulator [Scardovia inopinata JCM 12537]SUV50903.1 transcriptional regulator [Scardovia inopinata]
MAQTTIQLVHPTGTRQTPAMAVRNTEAINKNLTPAQRRAVELAQQQIIKARQARAAKDERENTLHRMWANSESDDDMYTPNQKASKNRSGDSDVSLRKVQGGILRSLRTKDHKTLREISEKAGVSLGYLSEVERGQKEASSDLLTSITEALGVRLSDMLMMVAEELKIAEDKAMTAAGQVVGPPVNLV